MRESIRKFFIENWTLKLTALILSFFLWLVIRGDPGAERVITVPFEIRMPRNMEITSERPSSVDVTVRGTISNMWFGQAVPTCVIDLRNAEEGELTVPLTAANVQLPPTTGLTVLAVRPARVRLVLERTISKEVPVRATLGEPPAGMDVYSVWLSPPRVVITGPRTQVNKIHEVATENIAVAGQPETFRAYANLDIRETLVHSVPVGPIEANIRLGPQRKLVTVPRIPIEIDDQSVAVAPRSISVGILVPITLGQKLKAEDLIASVSVQNLDLSQGSARVKPEVQFREAHDPSILIKNVPEVTVRRTARTQTGALPRKSAGASRE
jgi:YbbR domain-containing protein